MSKYTTATTFDNTSSDEHRYGPSSGAYTCRGLWPDDDETIASIVKSARLEEDPAALSYHLQWLADRLHHTVTQTQSDWGEWADALMRAPHLGSETERLAGEYRRVVRELDELSIVPDVLRLAHAAGFVTMLLDVVDTLEADATHLLQEQQLRDLGVAG